MMINLKELEGRIKNWREDGNAKLKSVAKCTHQRLHSNNT